MSRNPAILRILFPVPEKNMKDAGSSQEGNSKYFCWHTPNVSMLLSIGKTNTRG
jgi:hypothetical protein